MMDSMMMKGVSMKHNSHAEGFTHWRAARRVFRMVLRMLDHTHNRDAATMARVMGVRTHTALPQTHET
jgi:hypothetical protein